MDLDLVIRVVIENNARLYLGGLDDLGITKPQVQGIGFLIVLHSHGLPRAVSLCSERLKSLRFDQAQ